MITVETEGVVCRFDGTWIVDRDHPGLIHGALLKGVFYEQRFLQYIRSLQRPGVYVDVGAAVGTHSIYFAMLCDAKRVYALEPLTHNFELLTKNVALNELAGRVTPMKTAASDRQGEMLLTMGRFSEVVAIDRLDNLIREPVSVIKVDVEGMEPEVLRGATRILRKDRPQVFAEAATKPEFGQLSSLLRPLGYEATGRVFNATPTYEFAPIPADTLGRRAYLGLVRIAGSPIGGLLKAIVPRRLRRALLRRLRGNLP